MIVELTTEQIIELLRKDEIKTPKLLILSWKRLMFELETNHLYMGIESFIELMTMGQITYGGSSNFPNKKLTIKWTGKKTYMSGAEIDLFATIRETKKKLENPHYVLIDLDIIIKKIEHIINARYTDELLPPTAPKGVSSKETLEEAKKIAEQWERDLLEGSGG